MVPVWMPLSESLKKKKNPRERTSHMDTVGKFRLYIINKVHIIFCKKLHCFSRFWYSHPSWMLTEKGEDQKLNCTIRREAMATVPTSDPQQLLDLSNQQGLHQRHMADARGWFHPKSVNLPRGTIISTSALFRDI